MKEGVLSRKRSLLLVLLSGVVTMGTAPPGLLHLLPDRLDGWKGVHGRQVYDRDTLFEYIDGGAELYLSYGFKKAVSGTYAKPGQPDIVVDLFDMGTSENAFGVFSHSMETVDDTFGQGSQYSEGLLLFWKGRYYVSIISFPETSQSKKALFALGRKIERSIPSEGPLPAILGLLPETALVRESVRYFRHYAWLNSHCFIADGNILHITDDTDALLARYREGDTSSVLLLVEYKGREEARSAYRDFLKHYLPDLSRREAVKVEDGSWTACRLQDEIIAVVMKAPDEGSALKMLKEVQRKARLKGGEDGKR